MRPWKAQVQTGGCSMADPMKPANDGGSAPALGVKPIFYQDPRPLDPSNFGKHGLKRSRTCSFAAKDNTIPISLAEFQHAQKCYPIIFVGDPPQPAIVVGFAQGENLFVSPEGTWLDDFYVPNYVRRYPFVLAEVPGDERLFLCADAKSDMITDKNPDAPFFVDGKPTEIVSQALEFCRRYQEEIVLTRAFSADLKKHNLLTEIELQFTRPDGTQQAAGKVVSIDSAAFEKLPDDVFLNLRKGGVLPCFYFQQVSLANWSRLMLRREKLFAAKQT